MGRHDETAHWLHIKKHRKFKQPKPALPNTEATMRAPQEPRMGEGAYNQFR